MSLEHSDLADRLLAGDKTVLKDLEADVWPGVRWRILCRFAGRLFCEDMRDLLQETRLALWQNRLKCDSAKGSVASWFAGIAFNKARELAKSDWLKQRRRERSFDLLEVCLPARTVEGDGDGDAERPAESRRLLLLRECLARMSPRRREILFACRACDGDSPSSRQLAEEFGTTPEVIRQELHRAEAEIRNRFAEAKRAPFPPPLPRN